METYFAGLELQKVLILGIGIIVMGFVLKKLFKLAITIVLILAFVYYGLPIIQTVIAK